MIRVLVADDHGTVRKGLESLLSSTRDMEWVGSAEDGRRAVSLAAERAPDVVVMDLSMPVLDGIGATRRIRAMSPRTKVLVLTGLVDRQRITDALAAGAVGVVAKDADPAELLAGIRCAAGGDAPPCGRSEVGR